MSKPKPVILITGAGGFTGIHACSYFYKNNYEVTGIYRNLINVNNGQWNKLQIDLQCYQSILNAVKKIRPDYVLHLAGSNSVTESWEDPFSYFNSNVINTLHLLEAVRSVSPRTKIVITTSLLQFSPQEKELPNHPYGVTKLIQKLLAEYWSALFSLNVVIAKPSNLIGPGPSKGICRILVEKIVSAEKGKGKPIIEVTNLQNTRDFLDVRDAVRAYEILLQKGLHGEEYEITSGYPRTLENVISLINGHTKHDLIIQQQENTKPDIYKSSNGEAIVALGWKPIISFEDSIEDIFLYVREEAE
ncbi:NAD-dependent epimerase/dehydratase family protein [Fictibacillus arsenicus]|uniref:NAD-dependent epimerase/dehydratase family protein n=1 Tax=Fictibacillus arsenicus TaxID=255247 RepID=UPI0009F716B0|nr:NAD-dependent epimerase/dehydratase family protein [Fictibacillus arsenicus]